MAYIIFTQEMMEKLMAKAEADISFTFLKAVNGVKAKTNIEEFLTNEGADPVGKILSFEVNAALLSTGLSTAKFLSDALGKSIDYDITHPGVIEIMNDNRLRLISDYTRIQREATREALRNGIERGLNPRKQAQNFKDSMGLSERHIRWIENYRSMLENGRSEALDRELRDRRFDPTVRRSQKTKTPMSQKDIDRMVERYRDRVLKYRAETIARTEALSAVHAAIHNAYTQAVESGSLDRNVVEEEWITAHDERRRASHGFMHGQIRPMGEPFLSGDGNLLRYPGDIDAPASDRVNCRCVKTYRIKK